MKRQQQLETILVISIGFLVLYYVFHIPWFILVSLIVGLIGIFSSYLSSKITWLWEKLAQGLNYLIPKIILSIVFYLFLFPLSLLSRIGNKDPLLLSKKYPSYFVDRDVTFSKDSFKKTW